ncbi:WD40-repeat-containing domain protein [Cladochytrium replicatum]|nr:WD40-repeat-containing domain protein [Cladochytrium replicatum]
MKEKMLAKLERDRLVAKGGSIETELLHDEKGKGKEEEQEQKRRVGKEGEVVGSDEIAANGGDRGLKDRQPISPSDPSRTNQCLSMNLPMARPEAMKQIHVVHGHALAISSVKFHPKNMILATVSDEKCWKMWAFPSGELTMSARGTKTGLRTIFIRQSSAKGCNGRGAHLATASGDGTVKIWDFGRGKCRQTFRGHAFSVYSVEFQPFSNVVVTCSGDKTISLWDTRTGKRSVHRAEVQPLIRIFLGDKSSVWDSGGVVRFWDLRKVSELESVDFGPHPGNRLGFDASGNVLAVASNDDQCKL